MRKTIYVPDDRIWDRVKAEARGAGLSVSAYLLGGGFVREFVIEKKLEQIEEKLDLLIPDVELAAVEPMSFVRSKKMNTAQWGIAKSAMLSRGYVQSPAGRGCSYCGVIGGHFGSCEG